MNKKILVGFEVFVSAPQDFCTDAIISFELLQKLREISISNYIVKHIKYIERDNIKIYCTIEPQEVPLLSRGKDKATKKLLKEAMEKYSDVFESLNPKFTWSTINPIYLIFSEGDLYIYRQYPWETVKVGGLHNTMLWYDYYGEFQVEIDTCLEEMELVRKYKRKKEIS
jgi:hypothetical protein